MDKHEEIIRLLAVYDDLSASERTEVDAHVAACADCAAKLAAYQEMDYRLQQLPRLQPESSLRQDFYAKMESNMSSYKRNKQIRRIPAFALQILVVGAIILLGFGFWADMRQQEVSIIAPDSTQTIHSASPLAIENITFQEKSYAPGDTLIIFVHWDEIQTTGEEIISMKLMDFESGAPIAQRDEPLIILDSEQKITIHELTLPSELDDGAYPLEFSVYNQNSGKRIAFPTETVIAPQPVIVGIAINTEAAMPILETAVIRLESWSPDSQYFVLREFDETDLANGATGTLRVYDTNTGSFCMPGMNADSWSNGKAWIDDHTLAYINSRKEMSVGAACEPFMGHVDLTISPVHSIMDQSHNRKTLLLHVDNRYLLYHLEDLDRPDITRLNIPEDVTIVKGTFSPDDEHLALITDIGTILFVQVDSGDIVQSIPWQLENQIPDPLWLGNDLLLARPLSMPEEHALITIQANPDPEAHSGSFIVNLDGTVTPLETFFNTEIDDTKQILAAPNLAQNSYTILLASKAEIEEPESVRVYNSTTGKVETLPYTEIWQGGITEDGRYLLTSEESSFGYGNGTAQGVMGEEFEFELDPENDEVQLKFERQYLVREVTAIGETFDEFMTIGPSNAPTSPDHVLMGNFSAGLLHDTSTFPKVTQAEQWFDALGFSDRKDILWSPDAQYVAVVGGIEGTNQSQLFVLTTKPSFLSPDPAPGTLIPARVVNTRLEGLPLRTAPGGELIGTLSEGTTVNILADEPTQSQNNQTWQKVRTLGGVEGWVVAEFLTSPPPRE